MSQDNNLMYQLIVKLTFLLPTYYVQDENDSNDKQLNCHLFPRSIVHLGSNSFVSGSEIKHHNIIIRMSSLCVHYFVLFI